MSANKYININSDHKEFSKQVIRMDKHLLKLLTIIREKTDYKIPVIDRHYGLKFKDIETALGVCSMTLSNEIDMTLYFDRYILTNAKTEYIKEVGTHEFCHAIVEYNAYLKTGIKEITIGHGKEWQDLMILLGEKPNSTYNEFGLINKCVLNLEGTKTKKYKCTKCDKVHYIPYKQHTEYKNSVIKYFKTKNHEELGVILCNNESCGESAFLLPFSGKF